jgi:hypothetical protein
MRPLYQHVSSRVKQRRRFEGRRLFGMVALALAWDRRPQFGVYQMGDV